METINLPFSNTFITSIYARLKYIHSMTDGAYMSELFDKPVNVQKESLSCGSNKLQQAHKKVCNDYESRRKTTHALKDF